MTQNVHLLKLASTGSARTRVLLSVVESTPNVVLEIIDLNVLAYLLI